MWGEVVKRSCLSALNIKKTASGVLLISFAGWVKGDSATILSQWQLNVFLPSWSPFVWVYFLTVSLWLASQLWKTMVGVMLNANTSSKAAATIFFMARFLNNVYYLLLCCKYIHFAGMHLMTYSFLQERAFFAGSITHWGDTKAIG